LLRKPLKRAPHSTPTLTLPSFSSSLSVRKREQTRAIFFVQRASGMRKEKEKEKRNNEEIFHRNKTRFEPATHVRGKTKDGGIRQTKF
jgi:hypothetical protein